MPESLFVAQADNFNEKVTVAQVLSYEFYEITKNTFFTEHLWRLLLIAQQKRTAKDNS